MRRKEREVTELGKMDAILSECSVCRISLNTGGAPYIVPLNFAHEMKGGRLTLYFHCAKSGRKLELIKNDPRAGFETDIMRKLAAGKTACDCTALYSSVCGSGVIGEVEDDGEKLYALRLLMKHYTGTAEYEIPKAALDAVCVLRLDCREFSCKENAGK